MRDQTSCSGPRPICPTPANDVRRPLAHWFSSLMALPLCFLGAVPLSPAASNVIELPTEAARLIQAAGNAPAETERWRLLNELKALPNLPASVRGDLEKLLPVVNDWATARDHWVTDARRAAENGYLCGFFVGKVRLEETGTVYPPKVDPASPLHPIWCYYRARALLWQVVQSGPLLRVQETRDAWYGEARRLLEITQAAFPSNHVVGMYLGQPVPWPRSYPPDDAAPEWANLQREGLEKLADIIHWWIRERQLPDGQFGGGWGDDVEMWRWWIPVMVAFRDPVIEAAQERLSNGLFRQPHLKDGFTARVTDVEHSNEDTTDTILPMMHLKPDDPLWQQRALRLAELMRERWTGRNARGQLQFKSIYFSVDKVDTNSARAFDTVYHPSIVQPTLLYWQRTGDPALTSLFGEWLKVWVDAARRAENGKPAGVLPSVIHWPSGAIGAPGKPWWQPFPLDHNDALYNWPGATRLMTSTLLLAYHLTGQNEYLDPLRSMAALRMKFRDDQPAPMAAGSPRWCARQMGGFLPDTLAKYRLLTGDTNFDALLSADASGYAKFRLNGQRRPLVQALRRNAEAFRSNWEGYTSEMRWTDRVMSFTRNYLEYLPEPPPPPPSPEVLYATATGDPGTPLIFPLNAVRWLTLPREIAALVTHSDRTSLTAELYHFGNRPRPMEAEFYLLQPGEYVLKTSTGRTDTPPGLYPFTVRGPRARVSFELPPRTVCSLEIRVRR